MSKEYFDLILFAPLDGELEAVFESFPHLERRTSEDILKYTIDLGVEGLTGLVAQPPEWGNQEALKTAQHLLENYEAGVVVCLGIAGALSRDLRLGDVCYSGTIFDVHERLKVKDSTSRRSKSVILEHNPKPFDTPKRITVALNHLRADPELRSKFYEGWRQGQATYLDDLLQKGKLDASGRALFRDFPAAINGTLICGPVVASNNYGDVLKGLDRKVLAVETESGGIFQAAQDAGIPALTVRGISDNADSKKTALEELTKGTARQIASRNAATYLKQQLSNPEFLELLKAERERRAGAPIPGLLTPVEAESPIPRAVETVCEEIDLKLKELCPEFPLTRKGYRLPSPRIRPIRLDDDPRAQQESNIVDLLEAVKISQIVFVDIPRNYPDLALPWVWADVLSVGIIGDNQVVPIVVDANDLRPPSTIREAIPNAVNNIAGFDGVEFVFIIHNVNTGSRSRVNHLASEIKKFPQARFVLITKGEGAFLLQQEILRKIGGRPHSLCDISFLAISEFIQTAFELAASEAEVIALKLKEMFSKFKLSAHPTYFAGIPRPMLSGLLQANRRAELIQLAVDGYLTLIATQDEEKTHLNRSTRARYLERLAVELEVEKDIFHKQHWSNSRKHLRANLTSMISIRFPSLARLSKKALYNLMTIV
jgi:nucleoside phosphorylase